jgi:hypothetical protein
MLRAPTISRLVCLLLSSSATAATCIPFHQASQHVGETKCVTGKVLRVKEGSSGVTFFDFCEDYRACSFTVVVFPRDLRDIGDVRQLAGKEVEIHGPIKMYDGRAEIILQRAGQLKGASGRIPPLPKNYDVEKKGHYSAGKFSHPSSRKAAKQKQPPRMQTEEEVDAMGSEQ